MKNRYEIRGTDLIVYVDRRNGEVIKFVVSSSRFEQVNIANTWYAKYSKKDRQPYIVGSFKHKKISLHRYLLDAVHKMVVDHIDGDTLNNRDENLRLVTPKENSQNRTKIISETGIRGVYKRKDKKVDKFCAYGIIDGRKYNLGCYDTLEEAKVVASEFRKRYLPGSVDALEAKNDDYNILDDLEKNIKVIRKQSSRYVDVCWDKSRKKWIARATIDNERQYLGGFTNETTASISRDIAVFKHYGATLPKGMKFNHEDIFNASTITWDAIAADPQLYHHIG